MLCIDVQVGMRDPIISAVESRNLGSDINSNRLGGWDSTLMACLKSGTLI